MHRILTIFAATLISAMLCQCRHHPIATQSTDAHFSWKEQTFTNSIGQKMIWIAPGEFRMGDDSGSGNPDELPAQLISLSGYHLGATEVTQGQWQEIMGSGVIDQAGKALRDNTKFPQLQDRRLREVLGMNRGDKTDSLIIGKGAQHPIYWLNHHEALEFCRRLTIKEWHAGRLPHHYHYTLPTEAQWENACRAGSAKDHAEELDQMAWHAGNSGNKTQTVAQKEPNAWGFYDMHGNVNEWCLGWYSENYDSLGIRDPQGPSEADAYIDESENGPFRVMRGGSCYAASAGALRCTMRIHVDPKLRDDDFGFRIALVASDSADTAK
ncbi:MAG: formylglycine-generating enzyme family protein [Akkermansiaceae bacterium]